MPRALLFSSDQEASRPLIQALEELELEVEHCPEIFGAVEAIARHSLDVILADLDAGPEANFLLRTVHELKLNQGALPVAIAKDTYRVTAQQVGAELILTKPIIADQVKYALLSCDRFLALLQAQRARGNSAAIRRTTTPPVMKEPLMKEPPKAPPPSLSDNMRFPTRTVQPSPITGPATVGNPRPTNLKPAPLSPRLPRVGPPIIGKPQAGGSAYRKSETRNLGKLLLLLAFSIASVAFGYAFSAQPNKVFASVTNASRRVLQTTHTRAAEAYRNWLQKPEQGKTPDPAAGTQIARAATFQFPSAHGPLSRARGLAVHNSSVFDQALPAGTDALSAEGGMGRERLLIATPGLQIPESIRSPLPEASSVRSVVSRFTLLGELEPVNLSEEVSEQLLLAKVQPSYPEQALKAGLQGAVVLQAWIGTDGSVRDLKLVHGSLLLGRAAYQAVKQWRYKPYFRSGKAMEAMTFVTVNFALPQQSLVTHSNR